MAAPKVNRGGRKSLDGESPSLRMWTRIPPALMADLQEYARANELTVSRVVRIAVERYLHPKGLK